MTVAVIMKSVMIMNFVEDPEGSDRPNGEEGEA